MPETTDTPPAADRNLLFGILALQMDFISRDALIAAMNAWVLEKAKPLGQILVDQGRLDPEHLGLLEAVVQAHIRAHHNDPQQSLASLSSASSVRQELASVADDHLQASLSMVGAAGDRAQFHTTGLSATQQARIDKVCDRFEAAWKTAISVGQRPRIEDYLGESTGQEQAVLLWELAALDMDYRGLAGENPSVAEYRARFPNLDAERLAGMLAPQRAGEPGTTLDEHTSRKRHAALGLRYRILRPHATGGLGEVFVAEDQELHREVALKEIKEDRAHDAVSRSRFLLEAEITGGLEHPGIVPVYGLGQYADGRPFYAMRFIKGDNLKEAIRRFHEAEKPGRDPGERSLALRQLLRRFIDVCNAVAYAHSRGVLHRDLKPGNIMVGKYGETLVVDWGLAKSIGRSESIRTTEEMTLRPSSGSDLVATLMGTALGTPAYMSPEQAAGRLDLLGPASDTYSLGATLYVLLTGKAPFEESGRGEMLQQVQRGEWLPPCQVKPNTPSALDAICRKAMALKAEDRYRTVLALAADVEHWLADEPVSAYREGPGARLARWGRRHRPLVTGAAALLLTAVVLLTVGIVLINQEKDRTAEAYGKLEGEQQRTRQALAAEAKRRQQTREALDMLSSQVIDEWLARQKELLPEHRKFLDKAVASYEELARDSGQEEASRAGAAQAYQRVGNIRRRLGQTAEAEVAYLRSRDLYQELAAEFPTVPAYRQELAWSHGNRGHLLADIGRAQDAERAIRDALMLYQQLVADFPTVPAYRADLAGGHNNLGLVLQSIGRALDAERAHREAIKLQQQLVADFPTAPSYRKDLAGTHNNLGNVLRATGRAQDAERAYREALKLEQQLVADFPIVAEYRQFLANHHGNLARLLADSGPAQEAESAYRDALKIEQQLAADFPSVPEYRHALAGSHNDLGILLRSTGRAQDAERAYREALKLEQQLVADFPTVPGYRQVLAGSHNGLAILLRDTGRAEDAERAFRDALKIEQQLAADFPTVPGYRQDLAEGHHRLGFLLAGMGRAQNAERAYRDALKLQQQLAADFPTVPRYRHGLAGRLNDLGRLLAAIGREQDAEGAYRDALKLEQQLAADFPTVPEYRVYLARHYYNLGNLLKNTGRAQEAELAFRDALKLQQRLADDFPIVHEYRHELAGTHNDLGLLLAETGRAQQAEGAYRDALKLSQQLAADFPSVPGYRNFLALHHNNLGNLLKATGRAQDAERAYRDALILQQQLAADFPAVPAYRQDLAGSHINLGNLLQNTGRAQEAEGAYLDALKLQQQLAADFPTVPAYRQTLAISHNNLGDLLRATGRAQEAERAFRDALKLSQQLVTEFPSVPDYRNDLAGTMVNVANLLRSNKDPRSAKHRLEEALPHHKAALRAYPRNPTYRNFFRNNRWILAQTLVDLDEHAAAADTAAQLIQAAVDPAGDVYTAACIFTRCVPLAERDTQLSEDQRKERAQTYADRAVAALRQAVQNGYKNVAHMKKDDDLDPLRQRADFQELLRELEEKNK